MAISITNRRKIRKAIKAGASKLAIKLFDKYAKEEQLNAVDRNCILVLFYTHNDFESAKYLVENYTFSDSKLTEGLLYFRNKNWTDWCDVINPLINRH